MALQVKDKEALFQLLTANSRQLHHYGVKKLGVFGSFADGRSISAASDVDLLVEFESDKKTYDNFYNLSEYLQTLLNRKVEIVTPQSLSKHIGPHILKQVVNVSL